MKEALQITRHKVAKARRGAFSRTRCTAPTWELTEALALAIKDYQEKQH